MEENKTTEQKHHTDSLWGSHTLTVPDAGKEAGSIGETHVNIFTSSFILLFFILIAVFFRDIQSTTSYLIQNIFKFKPQLAFEEKLSSVNQRNRTFLISIVFLALFFTLSFGDYFTEKTGLREYYVPLILIAVVLVYWTFKSIALRFTGWLTNDKQTFSLIAKIGYNHLIMASFLTLPVIIIPFFTTAEYEPILLKYLLYSYLTVYAIYLARVYQTIISSHFSHVFYILYLCSAEILPMALLTNFILSYKFI
jgi:hypothetical protein